MATIRPIDNLNNYAMRMVKSTINNEPARTTYIRNFLRTANDNKMQGPAIVSLYTAIRDFSAKINPKDKNIINRSKDVIGLISKEIENNNELKRQGDDFVSSLLKNYKRELLAEKGEKPLYNTLERRVALAKVGAVRADKVEPKSWLKKMFIRINEFCKPEE